MCQHGTLRIKPHLSDTAAEHCDLKVHWVRDCNFTPGTNKHHHQIAKQGRCLRHPLLTLLCIGGASPPRGSIFSSSQTTSSELLGIIELKPHKEPVKLLTQYEKTLESVQEIFNEKGIESRWVQINYTRAYRCVRSTAGWRHPPTTAPSPNGPGSGGRPPPAGGPSQPDMSTYLQTHIHTHTPYIYPSVWLFPRVVGI